MFAGIARFAIRFRRQILVVALLLTPIAALYGGGVFSDLKPGGFDDPNSESFHTDRALLAAGLSEDADLIALYTVRTGKITDPLLSIKVRAVLHKIIFDHSVVHVINYFDTGATQLVSNDERSTFVVIAMRGSDQSKIDAVKRLEPLLQAPGLDVKFGGISPAFQALNATTESDLRRAELITLPLTAALLITIFGSVVSAAVPLLLGGLAIVWAFTVLRLIAQVTDISLFAASIITVLGLGLAIDYSLFILNRYREELPARGIEGALTAAITTTGRAVAFSGITLAASLAGLFLFPQNFLRSMAIGGIAVALLAIVLALTVLPALLHVLGARINAWRVPKLHPRTSLHQHNFGFWRGLALWVMRHAVPVAIGVTAVLLLLASPFLRIRGSIPDVRSLDAHDQTRQVSEALDRDFFPHQTTPHQILLTAPTALLSPDALAALDGYRTRLQALPGVARVDSLFSVLPDRAPDDYSPFLSNSDYFQSQQFSADVALFVQGNSTRIDLVPSAAIDTRATQVQVQQIRALPPPPGWTVLSGGRAARLADLQQTLRNRAPGAWLFVAVVMFVVLFLVFGSITLPIKAMLMNLLSIGASFGAMVWVFQDGRLQGLLGYHSLGTVDATQPVLLFAIVFGLSMDYEVLLLTRIREEYLRGGDNTAAVARGLEHTGRLITSAAVLLAVVVGAFTTSDLIFMKQLGVGMALAIVLDATIVRALLVPATMRLMGRWNWWAPRPLTWLWLRAGFADLETAEAEG